MKILITAFEPFLGQKLNSSLEVLKALEAQGENTLVLPVSFERSFKVLHAYLQSLDSAPDVLVMLGQAQGRSKVSLERVALNWHEVTAADEDGYQPQVGPIKQDQASAIIVDWFPSEWAQELKKVGPVEISFSAGTYVCNRLYFDAVTQLDPKIKKIFVHLPLLPEQNELGLELSVQLSIIDKLLNILR